MKAYCAFMRGVNIGGKTMKMAEACQVLKEAGLTDVSSLLATGNFLFRSEVPQAELRSFLESVLSEHYADKVSLFVKNLAEVEAILKAVPFEEDADYHIYAFVCEEGFATTLLEEFGKITAAEGEAAQINAGHFYWRCRKGATLDSGFSKILGRKSMKSQFTSRNISTMAKVAAKLTAMQSK